MPARATDIPILLRRFDGVNRQIDAAYISPTYLRRATNWIPSRSYLLAKRAGTMPYQIAAAVTRIDAMRRVYSSDEAHRYLYAVGWGETADVLLVSTDDGPFTAVANGTFASHQQRHELIQIGDVLYVGNGVDPLKRVPLGGAATDLVGLGSFTDASAAPTFAADTNAPLLSGTYSYGWAVLNHTTRAWTQRSQARETTKAVAQDQSVSFPAATGYTLAAGERFHLFVAPVNLPIELAMDQTPEGVEGGGVAPPVVLRSMQAGPTFWPLRGVARTGNMLVAHRSRLWFAGFRADPTAVMATNILFPNAEQPIYNQADYFPVNAFIRLPAPVTGLDLAAISEFEQPESPCAIFTRTRTFLFFGDILNDDTSRLSEVSSRIGCTAQATIVRTPQGLFWLGPESVYQMAPGGGTPVDIGWPIAPDLREIPAERRAWATATYHKGFLKLAVSSRFSLTNDVGWWLDLRMGSVGATPRWFGPHTTPQPSCYAVGLVDPEELDRGFVAVEGTGRVLLDQQRVSPFDDDQQIVARLESGDLDGGAPFDVKLFSRVRVTAAADDDTALSCGLMVSGGQATVFDPIEIAGSGGFLWGQFRQADPAGGFVWDTDRWDAAEFAAGAIVGDRWDAALLGSGLILDEAQTTAVADRPRGLWGSLLLQHADPTYVELRDVEVRYHPVERPVRTPDAGFARA